ncbi:hypothetical protein ACLOJK_041226 [Asimina triloba]
MGIPAESSARVSPAYIACFLFVLSFIGPCHAQLSSTFYDTSCPNALATIQSAVQSAVSREARMAASLIRLHFHDCFVQGCDASVLLVDTASFAGEQGALQNSGSLRGFNVVDDIKTKVENVCPGIVSCADILAVAARDASVAAKGPTWTVKLGRRDSTTASKSAAESNLPRASADLNTLISLFNGKGLNAKEMVALSGKDEVAVCLHGGFMPLFKLPAEVQTWFLDSRNPTKYSLHILPGGEVDRLGLSNYTAKPTLINQNYHSTCNLCLMNMILYTHGMDMKCIVFRSRIYNETNIDAGFATTRRSGCPSAGGDTNLAPLDLVTPEIFDNNYYKNLLEKKGLLTTDQVLFNGGSTDAFVTEYNSSSTAFSSDFAAAMVKMGDISPLTGTNGQIRTKCSSTN